MWTKLKMMTSKMVIKVADRMQVFPTPPFVCFCSLAPKTKGEELDHLMSLIKAGDVILTRWDRYVTSKAVPGFWSHCGIVSTKKKVIHAALEGVVEHHILDFLRVDQVMVLRLEGDETTAKHKKAIKNARAMIGKDYDFIFDGKDSKAVYCFELVARSYPQIEAKKRILAKDIIETPGFEIKHDSREWRKGG